MDPKALAKVLKQPSAPLGPGVTLTKYDPQNPIHKRMIGSINWSKMFPGITTDTKKVE